MNISGAPAPGGRPAGPVPGSGGPRSEPTRRAILDAARAMFAARGYEATTIRAVAAQADVDASMVMRYFQSKAGLFTAAVTLDLEVPDLRSVPPGGRGESLVRHFISRWEDPPRDDEMIALIRTAATSETVADQLQDVFGQLVTRPIADLGDEQAAERGTFIAAQLLGVALCRYILHLEPLASMPSDDVVAAVAPSVQRYLTADVAPPPSSDDLPARFANALPGAHGLAGKAAVRSERKDLQPERTRGSTPAGSGHGPTRGRPRRRW